MMTATNPVLQSTPNPLQTMLHHAPGLTRAGLLLGLLLIPLTLAQYVDPRTFHGVSVWVKPTKFAGSLFLYLLTLAWFAQMLPPGFMQRRGIRVFHAIVLTCIALEMLWIAGASFLGTASHYNRDTIALEILYGLMGVAAITLTSATLVHGRAIWRHRSDPLGRVVGASLILTFALTLPTAGYLAAQSGHHVGTSVSDAGGLFLLGWSREVGDLRGAHFFATHAMLFVPAAMAILLWMAGARIPKGAGLALCLGFTALTVGTFVQAIQGQPFLPWLV